MYLREDGRWSIPIAHLFGVQIRVHVFFWVFALWTFYIAWQAHQEPGNQGDLLFVASAALGILAGSVFFQEVARCALVRLFGGHCQRLVLGPYGGMSKLEEVQQPRQEMLVYLAAPASSSVLAAVAALVLVAAGHWNSQLLHPLQPAAVAEGGKLVIAAKLGLWINALLVMLNLIPAFPFHGGQVLRAAILWRAPHLGRREASRWVIRLARLIACLMVVAAVFLLREDPGIRTWSALLLLSVLVFLGAEHEQTATLEASHEPPSVVVKPFDAEAEASVVSRRLRSYTTIDQSHELDQESSFAVAELADAESAPDEDDESRVDEVLMRVHQNGMDSLSEEDRGILHRASQRYRQRLSARA